MSELMQAPLQAGGEWLLFLLFIVFSVYRINSRKDHWFYIFKPSNGICCWCFSICNCISNFYFTSFFNSSN